MTQMELAELLQVFGRNKKMIVKITLGFGLVGLLYFLLPKSYRAVGSFYVTRGVDFRNRSDFTYEGYYAQQAGTNYAQTLIGLFESADIRSDALNLMGVPVTESNLRRVARNLKAKKASPQLVTLTVKAGSEDLAKEFWNALSESARNASTRLNESTGDPFLRITSVSTFPVVHQTYSSVSVSILVGLGLGCLVGFLIAVIREYL